MGLIMGLDIFDRYILILAFFYIYSKEKESKIALRHRPLSDCEECGTRRTRGEHSDIISMLLVCEPVQ